MKSRRIWHTLRPSAVVGLFLVLIGLYWYGAVAQLEQVNTHMNMTDQSAYMKYARKLPEKDYTYLGGRNRMPLYPFLQSLFYRPDMTDETFFVRGKYNNLVLSLCLLAGLAFIFRQFFGWLHSLNLLLIVAFTVFIFKAGFFQAELLFYFLNFTLFLLMWRLLRRISWRSAILTGIVAGLAHLTKASILPGLVIFLVLAGVKWGWVAHRSRHFSDDVILARSGLSHLLSVLVVGAFFLATVFPYINTSKRVYGRYFYNVNSTFYFWYDSWEEVKQGTRAHDDRGGWPDMLPEEIPSMSKYLREHTLQQMVSRVFSGGQKVMHSVVHSYGYFKYCVAYLGLLVFALVRTWRRTRQAMMANPFLCLFLVIYFSAYLLLYFWFAPIYSGNRLILAQFIPLLFTVSFGLNSLLSSSRLETKGHTVGTLVAFNWAMLSVLIVDIYLVLTERVGTMYGGW